MIKKNLFQNCIIVYPGDRQWNLDVSKCWCQNTAKCCSIILRGKVLKYKESGVCLFPSSPSSCGLIREYLVLYWRLLKNALLLSGRKCGRVAGGKSLFVGGGGGWTGIDREGVVWYGWASSIIVDLGERIKKEGLESHEVAQDSVWSTTKSGSQILQQ